jgi:hypothetical protein
MYNRYVVDRSHHVHIMTTLLLVLTLTLTLTCYCTRGTSHPTADGLPPASLYAHHSSHHVLCLDALEPSLLHTATAVPLVDGSLYSLHTLEGTKEREYSAYRTALYPLR